MNKVRIALMALATGATLAGTAQAGKICQPALTSRSVNGATLVLAKANALVNWELRTTRIYGLQWANSSNAEAQSFACRKRTNLLGLNTFACRTTAQPCVFE